MQCVDENVYKTKFYDFLALHGRFVTSGLNGDLRKRDLSHLMRANMCCLYWFLFLSATKVIRGNKY